MQRKGAWNIAGLTGPPGSGLSLMDPALSDPIATPRNDVYVFGIPFWNPTLAEFLEWWRAALTSEERRSRCVVLANAHTLNLACEDPEYAAVLRSAEVRLNDGVGFRIASGMRSVGVKHNFNGTDLIPLLFERLDRPARVFLYGAKEEVNALTARRVAERFPAVEVVGRCSGYEHPESAVEQIRRSNADVLLVALGNPKQERFMARYRDRLNVKIQIGCGGLFDFLSGVKPRAPLPIRRRGLEWAFRLMIEPRRMWRRYVVGNPVFLARAWLSRKSDLALAGIQPERRRLSPPVL
ncbi:MAG: WecB/TagA/CpsF family glycosyltransferase [Fimbriimonadales bacterium]|nr:WecB/TagA/CpsF family glycosyltransferase [Fimbriimonadales bacterium]